jgi:hypothetical protein
LRKKPVIYTPSLNQHPIAKKKKNPIAINYIEELGDDTTDKSTSPINGIKILVDTIN